MNKFFNLIIAFTLVLTVGCHLPFGQKDGDGSSTPESTVITTTGGSGGQTNTTGGSTGSGNDTDTAGSNPLTLIRLVAEVGYVGGLLASDRSIRIYENGVVIERVGTTNTEIATLPETKMEILLDKIESSLQPLEWKVLRMHYLEGMSGKEVARRLRLSASRICQIHGHVLSKLKTRLSSSS